jgi:Ca2+-binding EF-hand superfamily protein
MRGFRLTPADEVSMSRRLIRTLVIAAPALLLGGMIAAPIPAQAQSSAAAVKKFDTDNDGTLDIAEVKAAALALFDSLDKDKDGTLDKTEVKKRISSGAFAKADPDKDGTLSKDEYLALVEQRFQAADTDKDGTLSAAELRTRAGRSLLLLLQ